MRTASRHLLPLPTQTASPFAWVYVVGVLTGLGVVCYYFYPFLMLCSVGGIVAFGAVLYYRDLLRKRRLAASRPGDALCSFARACDFRHTDTWLIRATFEELQGFFPKRLQPFPLCPSDRFHEDLDINSEDIDDIAFAVAVRAGYSLDGAERNPLYGRVTTVGELIAFFAQQPKTRNS